MPFQATIMFEPGFMSVVEAILHFVIFIGILLIVFLAAILNWNFKLQNSDFKFKS